MKLLRSFLPLGTRILPAGSLFTLLVVGSLVGLEVVGRFTTSDVHDGLAAIALLGIGSAVAMRHRREPLAWVSRLTVWARRVYASAAWIRYEHGVDLRGTPPLPRRTPRIVLGLAIVLFAWGGLGQYGLNAIISGDFAAIQGYVIFLGLFSLVVFLIVDLLVILLEPRARSSA